MAAPLEHLHGWLRSRLGDAVTLRSGPAEVSRLALALEPGDLPAEVQADALFLHHSFRLGAAFPGLGVLASHDGFDAALTTGENHTLAAALGWTQVQALTLDRASGLIATPPQQSWSGLLTALDAEFGGHEAVLEPRAPEVSRLALMNAMRPELLSLVAEQDVQVYITGQMRPGGLPTARALGIGVIALGHRRTELWGLRRLAHELEEVFPELECSVYPGA